MKIYLDLCCLKRPFDDQARLSVRLEAEAVLAIQKSIEAGTHAFLRAVAHDVENAQNPDRERRRRVSAWLDSFPLPTLPVAPARERTAALAVVGFATFDAFHLAWAELLGADVFLTVDQRLSSLARRDPGRLRVRVANPVDFSREVGI